MSDQERPDESEAEGTRGTDSKPRRRLMIFGPDVSPAGIAEALNAEVARQHKEQSKPPD